jgi:hypothetical protein
LAQLPAITTISPTVLAIYRAYEDANEHWDSLGISVGDLGGECDRELFYNLRWASPAEQIDGQKISIFRTGDYWETRLVEDLEAAGVTVFGQQDRIRLAGGHIRGKIDGRALGIHEAPVTEHLLEFKSSKEDQFKKVVKEGVKAAKPLHWGQLQIGMHMFGLSRAAYVIVNKNTDERKLFRYEYDVEYCLRQIARAERIILSDDPPPRVCKKIDDFRGVFCKHKAVCFEGAMPRVTCRSCLHSAPEMHGDAAWSCARFTKPLSFAEQKEGCPAHLFLPGFIDGEQIDCDMEAETVTYRLRDGSVFVDGGERDAG